MRWRAYPQYEDSGDEYLGKIPEHWQGRYLKRVCRFAYGDSLAAEERVPGDYDVFGSNGVVGQHNVSNTLGPCLIVGRKGSFGKVVYSEKPCFAIDTTYFVDQSQTDNHLRWLFYLLQWLRLDAYSKDSAVPGLAREDAYGNLVPYCAPDDQRAISAFLDRETARIDALIARKERQIELLQEKRAALISHAVTKGLDPNAPMKDSGFDCLGQTPVDWGIRGLKFVLKDMKAGPFGSSLTKSFYSSGGYRVYGQEQVIPADFSIGDYYIPEETYQAMSQYAVEPGDVLLSCVGTFGKVAVVPEGIEPGIINPRLIKLSPDRRIIAPDYLGLFLRSWAAFSQLEQASRGGTMGVVNLNLVSRIQVTVPPLAQQKAIILHIERELSRLDSLTATVERSVGMLQEYRTALISAAVTGKIDVRSEQVPTD